MHNAIKRLQALVGATPDGMFGNATLEAVNSYSGDLLTDLHKSRCEYYERIATNGSAKFLHGWLNRANEMYSNLSA
jgi:lysozyme family protein